MTYLQILNKIDKVCLGCTIRQRPVAKRYCRKLINRLEVKDDDRAEAQDSLEDYMMEKLR